MTNQSQKDEMILVSKSRVILSLKGWHACHESYDTLSGLVNPIASSIVLPPLRGLMEQS